MAIETRTIVFGQAELARAAFAHCLRRGSAPERGRLKAVRAEPAARARVVVLFDVGEADDLAVVLTYTEMAAALIRHCGVVGIPLPRCGQKRLEPAGEGMALIVRLPEHPGAAMAVDAPAVIALPAR